MKSNTEPKPLLIKLKIEQMIIWSNSPIKNFPRHEKYVMGAEIRKSMYQLLRLVIKANRQHHRKTTLLEVDVELDFLRSLVAEASDPSKRYVSRNQYKTWSEHLAVIGRLVGGWVAFENKKG